MSDKIWLLIVCLSVSLRPGGSLVSRGSALEADDQGRRSCRRRACLLLSSRSDTVRRVHGYAANSARNPGAVNPQYLLNNTVLYQGVQEIEMAKRANKDAMVNVKAAQTSRQHLLSIMAIDRAQQAALKVKPLPPKARGELLKVRNFAALASLHARHAQEVVSHVHRIATEAAAKAMEAFRMWITLDANKVAKTTAAAKSTRIDKLAAIVASAAEPYHLALLRNQKFCAETYSKAKSAQSACQKLVQDSKQLALKAQEMMASGMGVDAQETFGMASGMINQAEELRQWGNKLYSQAQTACSTAGGYELEEQQAAANAAANAIINLRMKLPPAV